MGNNLRKVIYFYINRPYDSKIGIPTHVSSDWDLDDIQAYWSIVQIDRGIDQPLDSVEIKF